MDKEPYDPRSIANYILMVRRHFGYQTTQLELQKILYFVYGTYLLKYKRKLVDGYFEAWDHGPVQPLIFREFTEFGKKPITRKAQATNLLTGEVRAVDAPRSPLVRSHIAEIVLQLRTLSASQLREKSHARGGPWSTVVEQGKINLASSLRIPDAVISDRFHRHILPVGEGSEEGFDVEDFPPELNRCR